jgi:dCTP deaminase
VIASAQTLRRLRPIEPFHERTKRSGMTYGLGPSGYDVRIAETMVVPPKGLALASTIERFNMPTSHLAMVADKSTWARRGLTVQHTVIEPGWRGFLTLELTNHSDVQVSLMSGDPIAQIIFHQLDEPTDSPYEGKYQDQERGPQEARVLR